MIPLYSKKPRADDFPPRVAWYEIYKALHCQKAAVQIIERVTKITVCTKLLSLRLRLCLITTNSGA